MALERDPGDDSDPRNSGWCGCCGCAYYDPDHQYYWCGNCAGHVLDDVLPWEATWKAQTGRRCPYQLSAGG